MELVLLNLAGFLRPIVSIEFLGGVFEVAGIGIFLLIVAAFLMRGALTHSVSLTVTDALIVSFTLWGMALYFIYPETPRLRAVSDLGKAAIPLLSYTLIHNVIRDSDEYRRLLLWIIVGFSIPTLLSVFLIAIGEGVYWVSYWTGIPRWRGAYLGPHAMGHSMTLLLMTLIIYVYFLRRRTLPLGGLGRIQIGALAILGALAFLCLILSQVRSAIIGFVCFVAVVVMLNNRKALIAGSVALALAGMASVPYWVPWLLPELITIEQGRADMSDLGSSRPKYWMHNLTLYGNLPIDKQIAGAGLASRAETMYVGSEEVLDSHNDWLDLLMQTGLVGLFLYLAIQFLIFRKAMRLDAPVRSLFLGLIVAVNLMMFVSNSYVWRIQVGHLYFILLAFIESEAARRMRASDVMPVSISSPPEVRPLRHPSLYRNI